ncbi:unnamed protein product [Staurois parvus]|uniref:Secreted protein n=1 Tax=Staurois parvus TaxID=386267 RepID=A0ABN9BER6_9NEOB|nr:unnamed protein product [Staurois parvus]
MTLGRKGLTSGAIKGLTVWCFTVLSVCALCCNHATQSHTKQKHAAVYFLCLLAGGSSVLFTYRSLPRQCCLAIAR